MDIDNLINIKISDVKNTRIQIKHDGKIYVTAPSVKQAKEIIQQKKDWILKNLEKVRNYTSYISIPDNKIPLFGEWHDADKFRQLSNAQLTELFRDTLEVYAKNYLLSLGSGHQDLTVWRMHSKLGSYNRYKNAMHLSLYLAMLPKELIEYVIYHEYCHKFVYSHNESFWKLVRNKYPEYKQKEKDLKLWWTRVKELIKKYKFLKEI